MRQCLGLGLEWPAAVLEESASKRVRAVHCRGAMKPSIVLTFAVIGILMGASAVMGLIQPRQETFISIVIALGGALWISGAPIAASSRVS